MKPILAATLLIMAVFNVFIICVYQPKQPIVQEIVPLVGPVEDHKLRFREEVIPVVPINPQPQLRIDLEFNEYRYYNEPTYRNDWDRRYPNWRRDHPHRDEHKDEHKTKPPEKNVPPHKDEHKTKPPEKKDDHRKDEHKAEPKKAPEQHKYNPPQKQHVDPPKQNTPPKKV